MYCPNCGCELSEQVKFCPQCGVQQKQSSQRTEQNEEICGRKIIWRVIRRVFSVLIVISLVVLGLLAVFDLFGDNAGEEVLSEDSVTTEFEDNSDEEILMEDFVTTETWIPENGWHEIAGEYYYISNGMKYVELNEIDGNLYYFNEDGVLAVNKDVRYGEAVLQAGYDGRIEGITYDIVSGDWAEENYHFGNGGSSSILELSFEAEDCDSFRFYLEAHGEYGAKVNGKWKIYIRSNGKWEFIQDIDYTQPRGYFDIEFDIQNL